MDKRAYIPMGPFICAQLVQQVHAKRAEHNDSMDSPMAITNGFQDWSFSKMWNLAKLLEA